MEYESSNVTTKKAPVQIRKGFYAGVLLNAKEFRDSDGNWIENKYGPQLILDFGVYHIDPDSNTVTKPVTVKEENITRDVTLGTFVNVLYRATNKDGTPKLDPKTGKQTYSSAITPKGRITNIFKALGWTGPPARLQTEAFYGKWVELTIDDYENKDGKKASSIKDVKPFDGTVPTNIVPVVGEAKAPPNNEELKATEENVTENPKIAALKQQLADGIITQRGYDLAVQALTKGDQS